MYVFAPGIVSVSVTTVTGTYKDLADFGFIAGLPDVMSGPPKQYPVEQMPGVIEGVQLHTSPTGGVKGITITGSVFGTSTAELLTNLRNLKGWVARAVALKTVLDANTYLNVKHTNTTATVQTLGAPEAVASVTITFEATDPYWYSTTETTATFTSSPASTALGTVDSYAVVRLTGAFTNPTITVKNSGGSTVASMTLTVVLSNAAHYVEIDCRPVVGRTIVKNTGSTTAAEDLLTSGNFFGFLVSNADVLTPTWGTIEASVTAGSISTATAIYRKRYE